MNKSKILIFIDWYKPGFKAGGPIRSCSNIVQHLSSNFEFYFITSDTDYCETEPYKSIKQDEWNLLDDGSKVFYISKKNLSYSTIKKITKSVHFDLVYINGIYSKFFSIYPLFIFRNSNKKIIVSVRGMLAKSAIGIKSYKKKPFLFLASLLGLYKHVTFHATNEKEKQDVLDSIGQKTKVKIAVNLPKLKTERGINYIPKIKGELRLISLARISPEKNLIQLLELLKLQKGKIQLDLFGTKYDESYWKSCEKILNEMPENIKVKYCGTIEPEIIEETILQYHFMILLTLGENFGHVILESFMANRPVIISDQTPWKQLEEKQIGWDLSLSDENKISSTILYATNMNQEEFNIMVNSSSKFSQSIIDDKKEIEQTYNLFKE